MTCSQWIQLILSASLVLATIGLVVVTSIYAKATKKMADSIYVQSQIMQRDFELRIAPMVNIIFRRSVPYNYYYNVHNAGQYLVHLISVEIKFRHKIDSSINIPSLNQEFNQVIYPGDSKEVILSLDYEAIKKSVNIPNIKFDITMQPFFKIKNAENKERIFKDGERTVG
jgi:hypothetical protein